jgi:arsenate reductase
MPLIIFIAQPLPFPRREFYLRGIIAFFILWSASTMSVIIYHNPRCGKSRQTLQLLQEQGLEPEIIEYLKTPPSTQELDDILQKLGMEPRELMRKNETEYKANDLGNASLNRQALIAAMVNHPILIERPIVIADNKAAIGRPPEAVLAIL